MVPHTICPIPYLYPKSYPVLFDTQIRISGFTTNDIQMDLEHPLAPLLLNELLKKTGQPALGEDQGSCTLCQETFLEGDSPEFPITLSCGHQFGSICILKWLSPLRNSGHNSCPYCRAPVFAEWNAKDFPPPSPVVPIGGASAQIRRQTEIASAALSNIGSLLPPGGFVDFDVDGMGQVRLRQAPAQWQTRLTAADGYYRGNTRATRSAPRHALSRRNANATREGDAWLNPGDRAAYPGIIRWGEAGSNGEPQVYRPYRSRIAAAFHGETPGIQTPLDHEGPAEAIQRELRTRHVGTALAGATRQTSPTTSNRRNALFDQAPELERSPIVPFPPLDSRWTEAYQRLEGREMVTSSGADLARLPVEAQTDELFLPSSVANPPVRHSHPATTAVAVEEQSRQTFFGIRFLQRFLGSRR